MKIPFLLGRVVFGGFFLYNGLHHFKQLRSMAQYAGAKGVPLPEAAVSATGAALLLGGASVLLGVRPKMGLAAILTFLAGVSPVMHDFWNVAEPEKRQLEMINFAKNMALLGAALALLGVEEPWPLSVPVESDTPVDRVRRFASRLAA
jgi:uncharacterized membrane protein YphA (DoxX/SURF4 family)